MKHIINLVLLVFLCNYANSQTVIDTSKFHEFDFWLGEWDVYSKSDTNTVRAHSLIESVIDSFAIQENYSVINAPYKGKSFSKYNPQKQQWEQFWVDNSGLSLLIAGGLDEKGRMVLSNQSENQDGVISINEISWELLDSGFVNQIWRSKVGDAEWTILFDGLYKPHLKP